MSVGGDSELDELYAHLFELDDTRQKFKHSLIVDKILSARMQSAPPKIRRHSFFTAQKITRETLKFAHQQCQYALSQDTAALARDFEDLGKHARNAYKATNALIELLFPLATGAWQLVNPIMTAKGGDLFGSDPHVLHRDAKVAAEAIWKARIAASDLSKAAPIREHKVQKGKENATKYHEHAFLVPLAEAWIVLTGKKHSKSPTNSPFLEFARAAWADVYSTGHAPDLIGALRGLPERTPAQVAWLAKHPPEWLSFITFDV